MDFKKDLPQYREKIDAALRRFLEEQVQHAATHSPYTRLMGEHIMEFTTRKGKRIRPLLTIKSYELLGGKEEDAIVNASLSLELLQSYLLIHDDLMDRDAMRRGQPSSWHYFEEYHKKNFTRRDPQWFGNSMAVLAGDICCAFSQKAITLSPFPDAIKVRALAKLVEMNLFTGYGQLLDVAYEQKEVVSTEDILAMFALKTAHYTLSGPLEMGAIFADANPEVQKALYEYGITAGQAFQIQDDILGIFADPKKLGKPLGSDLSEGKQTFLLSSVRQCPDSREKEHILSLLGKPSITLEDLVLIQEEIKTIGALQRAEQERDSLVRKAKEKAAAPVLPKAFKEFLENFTDYLVSRDY